MRWALCLGGLGAAAVLFASCGSMSCREGMCMRRVADSSAECYAAPCCMSGNQCADGFEFVEQGQQRNQCVQMLEPQACH